MLPRCRALAHPTLLANGYAFSSGAPRRRSDSPQPPVRSFVALCTRRPTGSQRRVWRDRRDRCSFPTPPGSPRAPECPPGSTSCPPQGGISQRTLHVVLARRLRVNPSLSRMVVPGSCTVAPPLASGRWRRACDEGPGVYAPSSSTRSADTGRSPSSRAEPRPPERAIGPGYAGGRRATLTWRSLAPRPMGSRALVRVGRRRLDTLRLDATERWLARPTARSDCP